MMVTHLLHKLTKDELDIIYDLLEEFKNSFTKKQVIDALYDSDGDYDRAYAILSKKQKKSQPKDESKKQSNTQIQQQQKEPQKQPQQQSTEKVTLRQFDLVKYNSKYPEIKQKSIPNNFVNMVIVGHVDSGKSTLVGKLLYEIKLITDKQVQKNAKEAKRIGKESFIWAWITDESKEEKERGITMDIGYRGLNLSDVYVNILDSPGHKDFVPNMINGACQADYAILVVDGSQFESGFQKNGQTKEHAILLRSLGVRRVIIAINKMDVINWNLQKFKEIKKKMSDYLSKIDLKDVSYVGISAFQGENLLKKKFEDKNSLVELMESQFIKLNRQEQNLPFRMTIHNSYQQRGFWLSGKIESGILEKGQKYQLEPLNIQCQVKEILMNENKCQSISCGCIVDCDIQLKYENEFNDIKQGMVLCNSEYPIPCSNLIKCELVTLELDCPIIKGQQVEIHINGGKYQGKVKRLLQIIDRQNGNVKKEFPRSVGSFEQCNVEIESDNLMCLEIFSNIQQYGRIILRHRMTTIGFGKIIGIDMNKEKLKQKKNMEQNHNI